MDKYLKEILQDVISNLTSNTWRVRESRYSETFSSFPAMKKLRTFSSGLKATVMLKSIVMLLVTIVTSLVMDLMCFLSSCLALNDLIRGRQADDLIEHLREIWETLFRVLDDIKVSVQTIAVRFA